MLTLVAIHCREVFISALKIVLVPEVHEAILGVHGLQEPFQPLDLALRRLEFCVPLPEYCFVSGVHIGGCGKDRLEFGRAKVLEKLGHHHLIETVPVYRPACRLSANYLAQFASVGKWQASPVLLIVVVDGHMSLAPTTAENPLAQS